MREKFQRFMQGRYGVDQLGRFTVAFSVILVILSMITGRVPLLSSILGMIGFAGIIYTYYRMFSRNYARRAEENRAFQGYLSKLRHAFGKQKYLMNERKTNHIYSCPGCGQKIRIPRGKGKIEIECPKCRTKFIKKS